MNKPVMEFEEIHRVLEESDPPQGAEDRSTIQLLHGLVAELDRHVETAEGFVLARALFARSVAHCRLILGSANTAEASAEAEEAAADAATAQSMFREQALLGNSEARYFLGSSVKWLATCFQWRPDKTLALAEAVGGDLVEYTNLVVDVEGAMACSRLAWGLAVLADTGDNDTEQAAAACQRWTDMAYELLQSLPSSGETTAVAGEVAETLGVSALAAQRSWISWSDRQRLVGLVNRRREQLDGARAQIAAGKAEEALASAEAMIEGAVQGACWQMLTGPDGSPMENIDQLTALLVRHFVHQLSPRLWDRDVTAVDVVERLKSDPGEDGEPVQTQLDWIEVKLIGSVLGGASLDSSVAVKDGVHRQLLALGAIGPLPRPGHLAAALALAGHGSAAQLELDARDLLASPDAETIAALDVSSVLLLALQMEAGQWTDRTALRAEVWRLLEEVCLPLLRLEHDRGARLVGALFLSVAESATQWRPGEIETALGWIDEAEAVLGEGDASEILELPRAELALALATRDATAHRIAHRAASAFVRHVDGDPDLPDDETAFGFEYFVRALRALAVAARIGGRLGLIEVDEAETERALARLRELADDPEVAGEARRRANLFVTEIEVEELMGRAEFDEMLALDWNEDLVEFRAVSFLLAFLQADESVAAKADPALVQQALTAAIAQTLVMGKMGASEGAYLELLSRLESRERLGLGGSDALTLGFAAVAALDPARSDAAALALAVVMNLADLDHDPELEAGLRELVEAAAERFLPTLLEQPLDHPVLPRFLFSSANLALNLGSVRYGEVIHRRQVSVAAHLLSVASDSADWAGLTAYMAAELCRIARQLGRAERWMAVYDSWRDRGALEHQRFDAMREAIELDRQQLRQALSDDPVDAQIEPPLGGSRLEEADVSGRIADLAVEIGKEPLRPLDESDEAALAKAADQDLPPVLLLHHWNLALVVCIRAAQSHPRRDFLVDVTARIGGALLASKIPAAVSRTAMVPVLETLVEAAISAGNRALARSALAKLAATLNELFLNTGLSSEFLALRPTAGGMRGAAFQAFREVDLALALAIAETGRMKLLSSLASGGPQGEAASAPALQEISLFVADRLVAIVSEPDAGTIDSVVFSDLDAEQLASAVRALALPWVRLGTAHEGRLPGQAISDEVWEKALAEPSLEWFGRTLGESQLLIYPFLDETSIGAVVVTREKVLSFLEDFSEVSGEEPRADLLLALGRDVWIALLARLEHEGMGGRDWDVRLVVWDPESEGDAQQIGTGFWMGPLLTGESPQGGGSPPIPMLMPTARLLEMGHRQSLLPPAVVSFLGDPLLNLPGPWVEGISWTDCFGSALRPYLGETATKEAALAALCESDLVVFSGHTLGDRGDEGFGLGLADGVLTHSDLLELHGEARASTAILSCCSAAAMSRSVEAEVVGLVTALIALGVRQIVAPLVPIEDPAAGWIGARMAVAVAAGCDLRASLVSIGRDCVGPTRPEVSATLPGDWSKHCPYSAEELQVPTQVDRAALLSLLREFSVFGGGR